MVVLPDGVGQVTRPKNEGLKSQNTVSCFMHMDRLDIAVFVVLGVAALAAYVYFTPAPNVPVPVSTTPTATDSPLEVAAQTPTPVVSLSACASDPQPDACAGSFAYAASTPEKCQTWQNPDACRYFYYAQRAESEKDTLTLQQGLHDCLSINDTAIRASCLQEYAIRIGDPSYCQALEYGRFRQACFDEVSRG